MKRFEIISFHPGRQHNLEQAFQIAKGNESFRHLTGLYFDRRTVRNWGRLSSRLGSSLDKRSSELNGACVDVNPLPEFSMLLKRRMGEDLGYDQFLKRNSRFQDWVIKNYMAPAICIGFDTSSWKVFEAWKGKSFLILDLSVAIPEYKIRLAQEHHFDDAFIQAQTKGDEGIYEIYNRELELADMILCGSQFVKDSCLAHGIDPSRLQVLPYGADLSKFTAAPQQESNNIIKIAFVGSVSYRKGADVLLKVWHRVLEKFPGTELHFYGNVQIPVPRDQAGIHYHGFISQQDLIKGLSACQVSVLPTFFEGSSLATYQSMAMGLAVLTTPNAGSIIENEKNGLLVPYGDEEALFQSLTRLIGDEQLRTRLSEQALNDIQHYSWDTYGKKLRQLLHTCAKQDAFDPTSIAAFASA